uniref:DUF3456 domain-containing protein n=1 Tax=Xiphophorus couchianus TaxID=32473 RepID=A0A3B5KP90_9TELE
SFAKTVGINHIFNLFYQQFQEKKPNFDWKVSILPFYPLIAIKSAQTGLSKGSFMLYFRETRLTEAVDNICERILQYSVHAERPGSLRYAKGSSQTMTTLKNLVNKGVKVDLGMPYELWDEPSAEVTNMKKQCETMLEQYEDVVEEWYFHHQDRRLENFLCENHVLKTSERECLEEVWKGDSGLKGGAEEEKRADKEGTTHDAREL